MCNQKADLNHLEESVLIDNENKLALFEIVTDRVEKLALVNELAQCLVKT